MLLPRQLVNYKTIKTFHSLNPSHCCFHANESNYHFSWKNVFRVFIFEILERLLRRRLVDVLKAKFHRIFSYLNFQFRRNFQTAHIVTENFKVDENSKSLQMLQFNEFKLFSLIFCYSLRRNDIEQKS